MPDKVGWNHDEEKGSCKRKDGQEVGVGAYKGADGENGEGMRWVLPGEQTD